MIVQSFCPIHLMLYWTQNLPLFLEVSVLIVEEVCKITNCILTVEISKNSRNCVPNSKCTFTALSQDAVKDEQENLACEEG